MKNVKVNKIVLKNSASYAFFEIGATKNTILEGHNNAGKTSVLNALQFLYLPEMSLTNIKNKFRFKPGKDKKMYSGEETYDFYFSDSTSLMLFEIENEFGCFCIMIYGTSRYKLEYQRTVVPLNFEKIRHFFINDEITEYTVDQIKEKIIEENEGILLEEIKTRQKIKEDLITNRKTAKYSIVQLRDARENTLDNYGILLKTIYDISAMDKEKKKKLVADIIHNRLSLDKNKTAFNVSHLEENYKRLREKKQRLEKMENLKSVFDTFKAYFDVKKGEYFVIKNEMANLIHRFKEEVSNGESEYKEVSRDRNEAQEKQRVSSSKQDKLNIDISKIAIQIDEMEKRKQRTVGDVEKLQNFLMVAMNRRFDFHLLVENKREIIKSLNIMSVDILRQIGENEIMLKSLDESQKNNKLPIVAESNRYFDLEELKKSKVIFSNGILDRLYGEIPLAFVKKIKDIVADATILNGKLYLFDQIFEVGEIELNNKSDTNEEATESLRVARLAYSDIEIKKSLMEDIELLEKKLDEVYFNTATIQQIERIFEEVSGTEKKITELTKEKSIVGSQFEFFKEASRQQRQHWEDLTAQKNQIYGEIERAKGFLEEINSNEHIFSFFYDVVSIQDIKVEKKMDIGDTKIFFTHIKNRIYEYQKRVLYMQDGMSRFISSGLLSGFDDERLINFKESKHFKILVTFLEEEYFNLKEESDAIEREIYALGEETTWAIKLLISISADLTEFEKQVNEKFKQITISNLKGVEFRVDKNKKLLSLINKFYDGIKSETLDGFGSHIKEINNYLAANSTEDNEIRIEDMIEDVKYRISTEEGVFTEAPQSNGTETMIMLIFISLLFKDVYRDGHFVNFPIPVDEFSNIDIKNAQNLFDGVNKEGFIIIGATPEATPDMRAIFSKTVSVDQEISNYVLNPKREYLVRIDSIYSIFENGLIDV